MRTYQRDEWARFAPEALPNIPLDLAPPEEIEKIYAPLAELLRQRRPYVVGVTGSVAVGKSTFCRILQALVACWPERPRVEVVSTDGFLLPNQMLADRGILHRKGFPESYDRDLTKRFFESLRAHQPVEIPIYSHETYDRLPGVGQRLESPDLVIFEGVAALYDPSQLDLSIYLDATEEDIEAWFLTRVQTLRDTAGPNSYYWQFREMETESFLSLARQVWRDVNLVNLRDHILPTRSRADIVLHKSANHSITEVALNRSTTEI